ncbi:MAG: amidohydrolase family protein [Planctomycetes bacterium]|nr:amidohydrolase family protein [Planctomycetota bacterium]
MGRMTAAGIAGMWLALAPAARGADEPLVVKAGRILTMAGEDIAGGTILIRGGRIEAVGKDIDIPWDARVIDASNKVVLPGFVEAHTFRGLDRPNENLPSVPFVSTFDAINPLASAFEDALRQGISTLFVAPGNFTMIGGQGCVVKPAGTTTEQMIVVKNHALKISLQPRSGLSRMAHLAALRREFDALLEYLHELEEKKGEAVSSAEGSAELPAEIESKREVLARFLHGKIPGFVYCPSATDVLKAIELSHQYKFKMKLVLGRDTWKAAADIAREKLEVILPPDMIFWETDEEKHEEVLRILPAIFAQAGVKFAFQTDGSSLGAGYMWYQAASAVRHGLPRDEALKAATLYPAQILDVADRCGSIEKGKDANLVILTGDPLDIQTWVDQVIIEGAVVYERSKDEKLKRILKAADPR